MKLIVVDGERRVEINDPATAYTPAALADWTKRAGLLMAEQQYPPVPGGSLAQVERAEQFDHDTQPPVGFGR